MASSARIEELEKKFNENPRRYFAPLANEYRKAGDVEQAIAICRTYVPQQPAHMSGHIVFGQALFEAGQHDEARTVFEAALALDPENLIALRHLGDIARARGEIDAARSWYRRVLDADPRNEEVSGLLASLDGDRAAVVGDASASWMEINPERTLELPPGLLESASRETVLGEADARSQFADASLASPVGPSVFAQMLPPPPTMPQMGWPNQPPAPGERALSVEGNLSDDLLAFTTPRAEVPTPAVSPAEPGVTASPVGTALGLEPMEFVPPPRSVPAQAAAGDSLSGDGGSSGAAIGQTDATPPAFVTETMAELYLQQGFREEALSVYRQLLAQNPSDLGLRDRVERIEAGSRSSIAAAASVGEHVGESVGESVGGSVGESVVGAATERRGASAGRSIRAFFSELATRRIRQRTGVTDAETFVGAADSRGVPRADTAAAQPSPESASAPDAPASEAPPSAHVADTGRGDSSWAASPSGDDALHDPWFNDPYSNETFGASALASSTPMDRRSGLTETEDFSGDSLVPRATDEGDSTLASFMTAERERLAGTADYGVERYDAEGRASLVASESDTPAEGVTATEGPPSAAARDTDASDAHSEQPTPESPVPRQTESERAEPGPLVVDAASPGGVGVENGAQPQSDAAASAGREDGPGTRGPMQTGSVNVLFPQNQVSAPDEAAAHALSGAFGGPSQSSAADPASGRATRPAVTELSLDSVFRETPPPSAEPRRESSAFSFDQFFGGGGAHGQGSPDPQSPDAAPAESTDASLADAEQFSNWLAGLKKK